MVTDRDALRAAVLAAPDDDTPRLVYADWLEETGDPVDVARAHFIRLEIEAERLPPHSPEQAEVERRAAGLFNENGDEWNRELPDWTTWPDTVVRYRRGFVEEVGLTYRRFAREGGELFAVAPVRTVRLRTRSGGRLYAPGMLSLLVRQPALPDLSRVTTVQLGPQAGPLWAEIGNQPAGTQTHFGWFAAYPTVAGLRRLELSGNEISDGAIPLLCRSLVTAVFCDMLTELDLSDNRITDAGGCFLGTARGLDRLSLLDLTGNQIGDAATLLLRARFGDRVRL